MFSPGGLGSCETLYKARFTDAVIEALERKLDLRRHYGTHDQQHPPRHALGPVGLLRWRRGDRRRCARAGLRCRRTGPTPGSPATASCAASRRDRGSVDIHACGQSPATVRSRWSTDYWHAVSPARRRAEHARCSPPRSPKRPRSHRHRRAVHLSPTRSASAPSTSAPPWMISSARARPTRRGQPLRAAAAGDDAERAPPAAEHGAFRAARAACRRLPRLAAAAAHAPSTTALVAFGIVRNRSHIAWKMPSSSPGRPARLPRQLEDELHVGVGDEEVGVRRVDDHHAHVVVRRRAPRRSEPGRASSCEVEQVDRRVVDRHPARCRRRPPPATCRARRPSPHRRRG